LEPGLSEGRGRLEDHRGWGLGEGQPGKARASFKGENPVSYESRHGGTSGESEIFFFARFGA
jgi:hypothetical protein